MQLLHIAVYQMLKHWFLLVWQTLANLFTCQLGCIKFDKILRLHNSQWKMFWTIPVQCDQTAKLFVQYSAIYYNNENLSNSKNIYQSRFEIFTKNYINPQKIAKEIWIFLPNWLNFAKSVISVRSTNERWLLHLQNVSKVLFLWQNFLPHQLQEGELWRHGPAQNEAEDRVVRKAHNVLHHPEVRPENSKLLCNQCSKQKMKIKLMLCYAAVYVEDKF